MNTIPEKAVITLATGKDIYINMAVNLARSFKHWHSDSSIEFFLATDQVNLLPDDVKDINIIELEPDQFGRGFSPKLHLNKIAPAQKTLFIDADCLLCGSLESVFDRFEGKAVSVIGYPMSSGEWFGDIASVCKRFNVESIPRFNGGMYYLEKGDLSDQVYSKAQELEPQYDEIGLIRLRNRPNDELMMSIAMALHGQSAIEDDATIYSDPFLCQGPMKIDTLGGSSTLTNPPAPHPLHRDTYCWNVVHPLVVHFLGHHTTVYPYSKEKFRLEYTQAKGWPKALVDVYAFFGFTIPETIIKTAKDTLRPAFHKLFGTRRIKVSERVIAD